MSAYTVAELAERFGLVVHGDTEARIIGVCTLLPGQPEHLSFLAGSRLRKELVSSQAGTVVMTAVDAESWSGNALISSNPQADYARIAALFDTFGPICDAGQHPGAMIDPQARVHPQVRIGAGVVVAAGARIAEGCEIGAGSVIGRNVVMGPGCRLVANVTLCDAVQLGSRVHIQPGVVIGGRGFGLVPTESGWLEVPQLGSVRIGDDVEIGANSCIDRGAIDDTVIERGVKIDNLVQIGHNCFIGAHTAIAGCVGIAGSCRIGAHCQIGGASNINGHITIADHVIIAATSLVWNSIEEPAAVYSASLPAQPATSWRRQLARLRKIEEMNLRIKSLEKKS